MYTALGYKLNRRTDDFDLPQLVRDSTRMYVINAPQHGQLVQSNGDKEAGLYSYQAQEDMLVKTLLRLVLIRCLRVE